MDLLVIDDDLPTRKMLHFVLEQQAGHHVTETEDAASALELLQQRQFDLLIMDVMMPGTDGVELCRRVRKVSNVPIIMVTARDRIPDRIHGLRAGADDYLAKPFDPSELLARVEAVLRRARRSAHPDRQGALRVGVLTIDLADHTAQVERRKAVQLTPTEFRLLLRLARCPGTACSREDLMEGIWGTSTAASHSTLTSYITDLRRKLEPEPEHPRLIATVRGAGYRLDV